MQTVISYAGAKVLCCRVYVMQRNQRRGKIIRGINNFLRDQGSKFPTVLGSRIKIWEKMRSVTAVTKNTRPTAFKTFG